MADDIIYDNDNDQNNADFDDIFFADLDDKVFDNNRTIFSVQISSMKCGLLPLSQESALIGDVSYHR